MAANEDLPAICFTFVCSAISSFRQPWTLHACGFKVEGPVLADFGISPEGWLITASAATLEFGKMFIRNLWLLC
jgi:hypothetical protein